MHASSFLSKVVPLFAVAGSLLIVPKVLADTMYIWAEEVGNDVIFYHEGSIDLTGFPMVETIGVSSRIDPSNPTYSSGGGTSLLLYSGVLTSPPMYGMGGTTPADSETGDYFGFAGSAIAVPAMYTSGSPISGSMTFLNTDFVDLGVVPAPLSFSTNVGSNTIFLFTTPPDPPAVVPADNSALNTSLLAKIKKLQKKIKKLKKKGKKAKAKKLSKKVKKLKKKLL